MVQGGSASDVFSYTVSDVHGATSVATVTFNITGTNDAASIGVVPGGDYDVTEAGGTANTTAGDPDAAGQLTISDVDTGEDHFVTPSSLSGTYGTFTFNTTTGEWTYALDQSLADPLTGGQSATDTLTVHSADGTASHDIVVNITGTNDAPTAGNDTANATEDAAPVTGTVATNDSDVDDGATLSYALNGTVAGLTIDPDGSYSFDPSDAAYQHLADGATTDVVATYTVTDDKGATDTATLTIHVTGVNDAPTAGNDTANATEDAAPVTGTVATNDSDVDDGATLSYALNGTVAGLTIDPDGSYSFDPSDAAYQHLADGATTDVVATYTVTDDKGATDTATLTIHVTGVNDAPTAGNDTANATEDAAPVTGTVATNDSDVDDGATLSYALNGTVAGLTIDPDGSYSFDPVRCRLPAPGGRGDHRRGRDLHGDRRQGRDRHRHPHHPRHRRERRADRSCDEQRHHRRGHGRGGHADRRSGRGRRYADL